VIRKPTRRVLVALLAIVLAVGGGIVAARLTQNDDEQRTISTTPAPSGHDEVQVIADWIGTLSDGDPEKAADYFAVPTIAQNGTAPLRLTSRAQVVAFNRSLPCGGELVRARSDGKFINATFRLEERPGGSCGPGVGGLARTAFVIRDGKIVQWRRLGDSPGGQAPNGPVV